jgi:hypothetical protein
MTKRRFLTIFAVNFASYCLIAFLLGGDAVNGYSSEGTYFLAMNGFETEVSKPVYMYSMVHTLLLFLNVLCFPAVRLFGIKLP